MDSEAEISRLPFLVLLACAVRRLARGGRLFSMEIRQIVDPADVVAAGHLFDTPPQEAATERFLEDERHHLFVAYASGEPVGMVTGVEMTHPDKGTEMFLYELSVDGGWRRRGVGRALVTRLAEVARARGCYGMWVVTDGDNVPARGTYAGAGGVAEEQQTAFVWTFGTEREADMG